MICVGAALLAEGLIFTPVPLLVTIGLWLGSWWGLAGILVGALVLTYPTGAQPLGAERAWLALAGIYLLARAALPLVTPYVETDCAPECRPLVTLTYNAWIQGEVETWLANAFILLSGLLLASRSAGGSSRRRPLGARCSRSRLPVP